jgi:hypothetical protein
VPIIAEEPGTAPPWVEPVKYARQRELEAERAKVEGEIAALDRYLPLIHATGDVLEVAVVAALEALGLRARKAPKGFTADVLAETDDDSLRFGLEVTGTNGPIRKDSKKLTQLLEFERLKEREEKTVLVANTFNTTPVDQREEPFTPQVVGLLSVHPILLMTGWDLYRMVGEVLSGTRAAADQVLLLHQGRGVLQYPLAKPII